MTAGSRLDGAVPDGPGASQDAAIAALTRRVADLERRLNVMKVIVGLILAVKVVIVAVLVSVLLLASGLALQGRDAAPAKTAAVHSPA